MTCTKYGRRLGVTLALIVGLVAALPAQAQAFMYRVRVPGVKPAQMIPLGAVGDGISRAGGCASGAKTGCITWKPSGFSASITLAANKLTMSMGDCHNNLMCELYGTKSYSSGKWYFEYTLTQITTGYGGLVFGITDPVASVDSSSAVNYYTYSSGQVMAGGSVLSAGNMGHSVGDVYSFAFDMDSRMVTIKHNGNLVITTALPAGVSSFTPSVGEDWNLSPNGLTANFGQSTFAYPVPVGYNTGLW